MPRLHQLKPDQLCARIDTAKADAERARRLGDLKAEQRYLSKAARLGRVLAEVRTGDLFGADPAAEATPEQTESEAEAEPEPADVPRVESGASDTRLEAMLSTHKWATGMRKLVLNYLLNHGPHTPDEVSRALNKSPFAIRPRFSELHTIGAIVETGETRNTVGSGKRQKVWRAL
jgi:hypothetical protein